MNECLNLTVEDKNRPCYSCNTSHPDTDCPLFIPTDCILDYRGEPDLADEESESRGKSKLEGNLISQLLFNLFVTIVIRPTRKVVHQT